MKTTMEQENNIKLRPSRKGQANPMWGRSQSLETRRKQSEAMKRKHQQYRQWRDSQEQLTMDEFLGSEPLKEFICRLIREEIRKLI